MDLFTSKRNVKEGAFKVPFYRPPTVLSVTKESISKHIRLKPTMLYLRVMRLEQNNISEIICNPSYKASYVLHDFHDFVSKSLPAQVSHKSSDVDKGLTLNIHYVKGIIPSTHLRVACCLQVDQDILSQEDGNL